MSWPAFCALFATLLFLSALFSGSETGVYSLSRVRVNAEARRGKRSARWLQALLADDAALLITLLIGNNLMLELATHLFEARIDHVPWLHWASRELVVAVFLTPVVFLFGELLPKDLLRHRPHTFLSFFAPALMAARWLFLPLALPLQGLSLFVERMLGIQRRDLARALGREELTEILQEGRREGALEPEAAELAHNVLRLRTTVVGDLMVPWERTRKVSLEQGDAAVYAAVAAGAHSRVPVLEGGAPGRVVGYLHQLDVLRHGPGASRRAEVRPLPSFPRDLPVDRALDRMRISGQRIALVGDPERPAGIVTLMDLLATIAGGLVA